MGERSGFMSEPERAHEPGADEGDQEGLGAEAARILTTGRALISEIGALLGLEARLAAQSLAAMAILALITGGLFLAAWLLVLAAAAVYARTLGLPIAPVLAVLGATNLLLGGLCWWVIVRKTRDLTFEQTRASLSGLSRDEPTEAPHSNANGTRR